MSALRHALRSVSIVPSPASRSSCP